MIDVKKIAKLANIPIKNQEEALFSKQLISILDIVSKLQKIDTKNIYPTSQVTGQTNVLREDEVDATRMFSQEEALSNAKKQHNGFFIIPAILSKNVT